MVRGRGRIALCAVVAAAAGCTLLTGVGDLDPSLSDGGLDDSSTFSEDATSDGGGAIDAARDVTPPDTSTLLKAITFENGALVHPETGGDRVVGDAALVSKTDAGIDDSGDATTPTVLGGQFSLHVDGVAFVEQTFALDEIYIAARVRMDAAAAVATTLIRIVPQLGPAPIEIRILATQRLQATLGGAIGMTSSPLVVGKIYRIGVHVRKGKNANGTLEVSLAADGAAFGAPFASSTNIDFERPDKLQFGFPSNVASATFDDVKLDTDVLPPP